MVDYVINYTQTDGDTLHVINLTEEEYIVKSISEGTAEKVTWDLENKTFIRILDKEIKGLKSKIKNQKYTVGECYTYNKLDGISVLEEKIKSNTLKLEYLENYIK